MKNLTLDKSAPAPLKAPSAWHAALHAKCPKCRTGNMFANSMYGLSGQKMHTSCPACDFIFETEPGYFYVAMFAKLRHERGRDW
jgi:phage FluMu protein Com